MISLKSVAQKRGLDLSLLESAAKSIDGIRPIKFGSVDMFSKEDVSVILSSLGDEDDSK